MELVFATNNSHKLREIKNLLGKDINLLSLKDINSFEEIPETGDTLEENAYEKAFYIYNKYKLNCFADDTGLEIEALDGRPGVYSARYAGENCSFDDNMNMVLKELQGIKNRKAQFRTIISLIVKNKGKSSLKDIEFDHCRFEGTVNGTILQGKSGNEGFGYDPIFLPDGYDITFAEMTLQQKNKISHRGMAVAKLIEHLRK